MCDQKISGLIIFDMYTTCDQKIPGLIIFLYAYHSNYFMLSPCNQSESSNSAIVGSNLAEKLYTNL